MGGQTARTGHIGYGISQRERGHHYAARACRLLFVLARRHGMHTLLLATAPENAASRRTCELCGGELLPAGEPDAPAVCLYRVSLG